MKDRIWIKAEIWTDDGHRFLLKIRGQPFQDGYKEIEDFIEKMGLEEVYKEHDEKVEEEAIHRFIFGDF